MNPRSHKRYSSKPKMPPRVSEKGKKGLRVVARQGEPIESLLRRFKRSIIKEGILQDVKKHQTYEKPSEIRKRKEKQKKKNIAKFQSEREAEFE